MTTRRRPLVLLGAVLAASVTACLGDLSWRVVFSPPGQDAPSTFAWRNSSELWAFGATGTGVQPLRRVGGVWEALDLCGQFGKSDTFTSPKAVVSVAFDGATTWVLCGGTQLDGQTLIHYDAEAKGAVVNLPFDGDLTLIPLLAGGVALIGDSTLFLRDGETWKELGKHPFTRDDNIRVGVTGGRSPTDIYVKDKAWNGSSWAPYTGFSGRIELRDGIVWSGATKLSGGVGTTLVFKAATEIAERGLTVGAMAPGDVGMFIAAGAGEVVFWTAAPDDAHLSYLGSGPFAAGTMYGGGGFGAFYAVDASTVLLLHSDGGASRNALIEGD